MALTKITRGVIKANENYDTHNINSTGIVTAVSANFTGDVSIGGTLTYQDVTNIDSVGIITARAGVDVNNGHIVLDSGYSLQWSDSHERIEQSDGKLEFFTNNTEKVTISGGSLGIGIDNPNRLLHLRAASSTAYSGGSDTADYNLLKIENTTDDKSAGVFFLIGSNGEAAITATEVADGNTDIAFQNRGGGVRSEKLRIKSDGDVFIGNIAHANDGGANSSYHTLTLADTTNGAQLHLRGQSPKLFMDVTSGGNGEIYYDSGDLRILSGEPGGTSSEKIRITSDGKFGIGTDTPGSKLTVYETGGNAKLLLQRANTANNTDDYGSVLWRSAGGTAVGGINVARATAENDGYMFFQTTSGGTMSERMRIQPSGYIGIGEVAPGGRLTVKHANTSTSGLNATLKLKQGVATNGNRSSLIFSSLDDFDVAAVNGVVDTHSGTAANNVGHLEFWTKETGNATAQERMRVHPTGQVSINSNGYMGRFHIQQDALTEPALCIRHHDASLYKHMGTAGPNDRNGTNASNGGTYLHVRVRTVWNDSSMTMFRITGYYPYHDYTHSFVGMYRYGNNSYRTNPYGQTINNLKRATIHSIYNEAASPGYLVFVCDWPTNYTGLMFEHIGAGSDYGAYMQNDIEIIDSLRSTGTSGLTF